MKTMASTPSSTTTTTTTSSTTTSSSSLTRTPPPTSSSSAAQRRAEASTEANSCYFPGCRKDTNCNCDICLASINATLDLIPHSSHSTLTKLSSSLLARRRPLFGSEKTPPAKPKPISTPHSSPIQSTAKSKPIKERVVAKKATALRTKVLVVLMVFNLFLIVDKGVPKMMFWRGFEPKLNGDTLSKGLVGELRERIGLVQERIEEMINEKVVVDCSSMKLGWEIHQEGQNFFYWKCVIYKSWVEEVSVWGSPLRSSGLLPAAFSPRSLSVVSGKITEWSDGKVMSTMRTSNSSSSSWTLKQWNKCVMQLEANTWVIEYKRSAWLEGQGLLEFAWEMMRLKNLKMVLVQQTSLFFSVHKQGSEETRIPT